MSEFEIGILSVVYGFIAGYIFHGWEFDRDLAKLQKHYNDLIARVKSDGA